MTMARRSFCIGVDIGGTFTDVVLIESDGKVHIAKGISTTDAYERAIFRLIGGLLKAGGGRLRSPGAWHHRRN